MWGVFWVPLHWFGSEGVGGAWVSLIFNALAMLSALPWLTQRKAWTGFMDQSVNGLLLGTAFSLYTVSLVLTDVIHAILLFYLTPVWSTIAGWLLFRERLSASRLLAMAMGFAGLAAVLGVKDGIPLPRNWGDVLALFSGMCWAAGTIRSFHRPTRLVAQPVFGFALGASCLRPSFSPSPRPWRCRWPKQVTSYPCCRGSCCWDSSSSCLPIFWCSGRPNASTRHALASC